MRRYQLICAVFGLVVSLAHAQTTSLRQSRIYEGDIAELTIEYDAEIPSLYAIETSPLEADFKVLDVQSRTSRHVEENQTFHRMQWKIHMVARGGGSIRVPPLAFGGHHSNAILLRVDQAPATIQAREKVYIEMQAAPENPYPGQQIRITTRLFHNLALQDGNLSEPEIEQATVYRSGRDSQYSLLRAAESFDVLERSILLTADSSGQLPVTAASLRGMIRSAGGLGKRYIYRQGEDLHLQIREKPPGFDKKTWLPARQFDLALLWDEFPDNVKAGDSLGVTLSMEASGLPAEALPADLLVADASQYKIYADEAVRSTRIVNGFDGEQLIGRLQQRFVIVVQQPGALVIPAFTVTWWDIEQDLQRIARIESRTVQVDPVSDAGNIASLIGEQRSVTSARGLLPVFVYRHWRWLTALAMFLLLAGVLVGSERLRTRIVTQVALAVSRRRCRQRLRRACRASDADAVRNALIEWSRLYWGDAHICGLHHIEARTGSPQLVEELARLDAALFAERADAWRGERLWQLLEQERNLRCDLAQNEKDLLPGPYPLRS